MKKLSVVLVVMAAFGLALGACGGDGKNACEKAADVMEKGMVEFCQPVVDNCLFCECLVQGQVVNDAGDGCEAPDDGGGEAAACEGEALTAAEACLADQDACKQSMADTAEMVCQSEHMGDECEEDADCPFDMTCDANMGCTNM